ncbi:MAG: type II secretion system F family protein [Candidatus Aenigmarchaeota archaeon]|nr:type II secretion system F family protein [Candidatus Aenigmarchaeota archaeon]
MDKALIRAAGGFAVKQFPKYAMDLKNALQKAGIKALYEIYLGKMVMMPLLAFAATIPSVALYLLFGLKFPIAQAITTSFAAGVATAFTIFFTYHYYPRHLISTKRNSIEGNMPFAVNHMAAIASSGVSPFVIFKLVSNVPEYGQIMEETKRIVRNVEVFGMDMVSSIKNVADRSPSEDFRSFLYSVVSNIETGGDIKKFFETYSRESMVNYRVKRDKYLKTLSTYADFYTAVLIAAPLFFISILSIMALIGGSVFGLDIATAMSIGVFIVIPILNVIFLLFIHYTQPVI